MKKQIYLLGLLLIICLSCQEENLNGIAENQFVIEAFLYAGEPIDDIRLKTTFSLSSEEDLSEPINDAEVTLIKNADRFPLTSSDNNGFYRNAGDIVTVETGDVFQLEVLYEDIIATAETTVPTPTRGLSLSQDSLIVPLLPSNLGREAIVAAIRDFLTNSSIEVSWDNPTDDLYFMVVESVEEEVMPIFIDQIAETLARFRFVSEPTRGSSITFLAGTLESFGTYSVRVYHINQEYADLYENREQDSRDLNEPPSNVMNALGVFSAFNSQELFFEVSR